jgi:hypothetical protein
VFDALDPLLHRKAAKLLVLLHLGPGVAHDLEFRGLAGGAAFTVE